MYCKNPQGAEKHDKINFRPVQVLSVNGNKPVIPSDQPHLHIATKDEDATAPWSVSTTVVTTGGG
jgi:hypothetical protein